MYNAYSINSAYSSNGSCITTEGPPIALGTEFSYIVTAGEDQSEVQYLGLSSFREALGLVHCYIGNPSLTTPFSLSPTPDGPTISFSSPDPSTSTTIVSTVANVTFSPTLGISFSSPDPSTSTSIASTVVNVTSSTTTDWIVLSRGQKAAIGTAIPLGVIALLVLVLLLWQRAKKQRAKTIPSQTVQEETTDDNPPFLQPKPELQGEDSRHEMPAEDRRFELDEGNTRYELMTEEQNRGMNVQVQQQELRGEEFAVELNDRDTRAEGRELVT